MNILAAIIRFCREYIWFVWISLWWIALAITLCCITEADAASGSARAEMEVDDSIGGIVLKLGEGGVKDVVHNNPSFASALEQFSGAGGRSLKGFDLPAITLTIDGRPREGFRAWGEGLWRVGGYATDLRVDGSVGLAYRLQLRKFSIATTTAVSDGRVVKTVDARWVEVVVIPIPRPLRWLLGKQIIRRIPVHVRIVIDAQERRGVTRLVGVATGTADTSDFRCRGIRFRIAEPEVAATLNRELGKTLVGIRTQGTEWYRSGSSDIGPTLDRIGAGIRTIKVRR